MFGVESLEVPQPTELGTMGGFRMATFDPVELRSYTRSTSDKRFLVHDKNGEVVGVIPMRAIRELLS